MIAATVQDAALIGAAVGSFAATVLGFAGVLVWVSYWSGRRFVAHEKQLAVLRTGVDLLERRVESVEAMAPTKTYRYGVEF